MQTTRANSKIARVIATPWASTVILIVTVKVIIIVKVTVKIMN